jgi:hypothetical protein
MPKLSREESLDRVKFTTLIIKIQDDITKLSQIAPKAAKDFEKELERYLSDDPSYVNHTRSLSRYMYFRRRALELKNDYIKQMDGVDAKQVVCNIVLTILGLGVIYGLAVGINYLVNDKILFFKPQAVNSLETVFDDIDALKYNPVAAIL